MRRRLSRVAAAVVRSFRGPEWWIVAATLVVGTAFAGFAFRDGPAELRRKAAAESKVVASKERQALLAYQKAAEGRQANAISDAELADRIEREVLPAWREGRSRVESARAGRLAPYFPAHLGDVFRLRQEAWERLVAGLRRNDAAEAARFRELWAEADRVAAEASQRKKAAGAPPGK